MSEQRRGREPGGVLTAREAALLEILCAGDDERMAAARAQLVGARWGGYEFGDCDCFLIRVDEVPPGARIRHGGGPLSSAEVLLDGEYVGQLDLWVDGGRLHSVDYMPIDDAHGELPDPGRFDIGA